MSKLSKSVSLSALGKPVFLWCSFAPSFQRFTFTLWHVVTSPSLSVCLGAAFQRLCFPFILLKQDSALVKLANHRKAQITLTLTPLHDNQFHTHP